MGEARRRAEKGLPPRQSKTELKNFQNKVPWLPVTQNKKEMFFSITKLGAWIGIGALIIFWITVRFIGPYFGWWIPADTR